MEYILLLIVCPMQIEHTFTLFLSQTKFNWMWMMRRPSEHAGTTA